MGGGGGRGHKHFCHKSRGGGRDFFPVGLGGRKIFLYIT